MDAPQFRVDTSVMTILIILLALVALVALAVASYFFGADSRVDPRRQWGEPDLLRQARNW